METNCARLLQTMELQLTIYKQLLSLARGKQPVLIKGDTPELEKITKEEEVLILQVGRLEEQRKNIHQELANHFAVSAEELTLTGLIKHLGTADSERLRQISADLSNVLKELGECNRFNSELIKSSLDYINFSLNLLTSNNTAPEYSGTGSDRPKSNMAKILDRKI